MLNMSNIYTIKLTFRQFFEELGPIKVKELTPKSTIAVKKDIYEENEEKSPQEKINLWLPSSYPKSKHISKLDEPPHNHEASYNPSFNKIQNGIANQSKEFLLPHNSSADAGQKFKSEKKANLMNELFGESVYDENVKEMALNQKPLKTSIKTGGDGTSKSVRFDESHV